MSGTYDRPFSPGGINLKNDELAKQVQSEAARIAGLYDDVHPKDVYGMALEFVLSSEDTPEDFLEYVKAQLAEVSEG
ncbi:MULTISPECIES: hypothetical protein [Haloarcula]|uniref:hypothetical protein n=1 Tax=Haloarcula TaxID=2237 RepID=UPI0023E866F7|nr:hypothetical protein [Halomicroarcula sp. SHR3]